MAGASKGWFNLEAANGVIPDTTYFEGESAFKVLGLTRTQRLYGLAGWCVVTALSLFVAAHDVRAMLRSIVLGFVLSLLGSIMLFIGQLGLFAGEQFLYILPLSIEAFTPLSSPVWAGNCDFARRHRLRHRRKSFQDKLALLYVSI